MLKVAAFLRLSQWQDAGQFPASQKPLPSPSAVAEDLKLPQGRQLIDAKTLAQHVFGVWFSQMAWTALAPRADIVVRDVSPDVIADELAQLLWEFRHLANLNRKEN